MPLRAKTDSASATVRNSMNPKFLCGLTMHAQMIIEAARSLSVRLAAVIASVKKASRYLVGVGVGARARVRVGVGVGVRVRVRFRVRRRADTQA
eukprot:scaffold98780_cov50-Phaeocystis_antarctica.AAC.1